MHIVVFGANGATGRILTQQALDDGHIVTAMTRHPEQFPLHHSSLRVVPGDVFDLAAVERAVAGQDAVLSTLGVPFTRKPIAVYSRGIANIIAAMKRYGVRRLVCVSSSVTDGAHDTGGGFIFDKVMQPLVIATIGRTTYTDMRQMEAEIASSGLDWTIVRPSGLFATPGVTRYQMAEGHMRGQFTSRADLANCMLRQLTSDEYLHKAVAVITTAAHPSMLSFLTGEAFQRQPS